MTAEAKTDIRNADKVIRADGKEQNCLILVYFGNGFKKSIKIYIGFCLGKISDVRLKIWKIVF